MRTGITIFVIIALVMTSSLFFTIGCSSAEADREFIDFAETAAEEYLISVNERDFEAFSSNLGDEMREALPEQEFMSFADQLEATVGNYVEGSKKFSHTEKQSGFIKIIYDTEYTGEPAGVVFTLVLQKVNGEIKISGSWFNSPKLRGE